MILILAQIPDDQMQAIVVALFALWTATIASACCWIGFTVGFKAGKGSR